MWATLPVGCGDDGGNTDGNGSIDAAAEADAPTTPVPDAAPAGGTQQLGEFCEILQEGGPHCASGLDCCDDEKVCREPGDCQGSPGYLACTDGSGCHGGLLCCDIPSMRFCTKRSACADYGGTEIP
jgi:hypothetical protein